MRRRTLARAFAASRWTLEFEAPGYARVRNPMVANVEGVAASVEAAMLQIDGVEQVRAHTETGSVIVRYRAEPRVRAEIMSTLDAVIEVAHERGLEPLRSTSDRSAVRLAASSASLALASASLLVPGLAPMALLLAGLSAIHIGHAAVRSAVVERRVSVDQLDAIVIALALLHRRPFGAAFMVWAVDLGDVLLSAADRNSRRRLAELFGRPVRRTRRRVAGRYEWCSVEALREGDVILVAEGERIPVDGRVLDGEALLDCSMLTGEHAPVGRQVGEPVFAHTDVVDGRLEIQAERVGEHTNVARLVRSFEASLAHKVAAQTRTERFADRMVMPTLGLGALGWALTGPEAAMAVINADYGTGIRIAGPLALLESISVAARNGILIKRPGALEALTGVGAVVFDKTGTLTVARPVVTRAHSTCERTSERELLRLAARAEAEVEHPIARAVVEAAQRLGFDDLRATIDTVVRTFAGFGVRRELDGLAVDIGSERHMRREGVTIPPAAERVLARVRASGATPVCVARDRRVIGVLELHAQIRPEALRVIEFLRGRSGIRELHLLSGDLPAPTQALAEALGIEHAHAEMLPEHKAEYVHALQRRGLRVAMIGDGINDTIGLAQADCSMSLRGAAEAAVDAADVVFMDANLERIELLFAIAEELDRNVARSTRLVVIPNSLCIAGALLGVFGLGSSLVLNNACNLAAALNGMQAQRGVVASLNRRPSQTGSSTSPGSGPVARAAHRASPRR